MVDMRWGVTNEAQNDHMTSECCLREIKNCQNVSVGPNFVVGHLTIVRHLNNVLETNGHCTGLQLMICYRHLT